ncbi:MAG: hypothetical protein ACYC9Z_10120 [Casimicrobiaceae bacterium]
MSAEDCNDFEERRSRSKLDLDRQNSEAIARYSGAVDFTVVEAAFLLTGRDPIFWGAPSGKVLLSRKRNQKCLGDAVAVFKELLKGLDEKRLHAATSKFNGDGTYDPEGTRISRAELTAFANTCAIDTVPLPGTPELQQQVGAAETGDPGKGTTRPPKLREQEQVIKGKLIELSFDPKALPKPAPGKPGVKSQVRSALTGNPLFTGHTTFEKAWERLQSFKEIAYCSSSNATPP